MAQTGSLPSPATHRILTWVIGARSRRAALPAWAMSTEALISFNGGAGFWGSKSQRAEGTGFTRAPDSGRCESDTTCYRLYFEE